MVILDKLKEDQLLNYGFKKEIRKDESYYYILSKTFFIEGFNSKAFNNGKITMRNFSMASSDILYDLIKNDIVKKVNTPKSVTSLTQISEILNKEN